MRTSRGLLCLFAVVFAIQFHAAEYVWDFSKETYPFEMISMGNAAVKDGALVVSGGTNTVPAGLRTKQVATWLAPEGDFSISVRFKLDLAKLDTLPNKSLMMLADCKGDLWPPADRKYPGANSGFGIGLFKKTNRSWNPNFFFGYGDHSYSVLAPPVAIDDEKFHDIICRYLVRGEVHIVFDGKEIYSNRVPSGKVAPSLNPLYIGERAGASYWCLEGAVSEVRIDLAEPEPLRVTPGMRRVFERTEDMKYHVNVFNQTEAPATVRVEMSLLGKTLGPQEVPIPAFDCKDVVFTLPVRLRPGTYPVTVTALTEPNGKNAKLDSEIVVVAEENPEAFPIFMWQSGDPKPLAEMGFTAQLWLLSDAYAKGAGDLAASIATLEDNLKYGIRLSDLLRHAENKELLAKYSRVDRRGKPYARRNLDASNPEVRKLTSETAYRAARAYGDHPGLTMVMVSTEVRDGSQIAYNGTEQAAYKAFAGEAIPANALGRTPPPVAEIQDFPVLGNLDPEMPLYKFFRWWWVNGDGWNPLHRLLNENYKKGLGARADKVLSFYDPALRVPPIFGSAKGLDMLNQWTYSYPHPIKIATAVDEERAMARGNGGQKLMKMVQVIWYRDPPAPPGKKVANPPAWVKEYPDAPYITIAPDHLQESVWAELSRRLDVLSFHGYGSLVERDDRPWNTYRFTNPNSRERFKKLVKELIRPLGPVLKKVPERPMRTAVLYTLGSNIFGQTGSWGWTWGPDAEMHQFLQRAQLDPGVLFDEDVLAGRLDGVAVLALPNCAIMDQRVIDAIRKYQIAGGIVIGDKELNPLILPDITVDKQELADAVALNKQLKQCVPILFEADSPEVVTHVRSWKKSDYLFTVNDRRDFGDYVGMYGYAKEVGCPLKCTVSLARSDVKAIYDLMQHKEIPFEKKDGKCTWKLDFKTNDGRLNLALPQKIAKLSLDVPTVTTLDKALEITILMTDTEGKPVEAILPIEVRIHAEDGLEIVGSGYYEITDGVKRLTILPSSNDAVGLWTIDVSDLAAGLKARSTVKVK